MTSPEPSAYHNHQLRHQHQQRPGPHHAQQPAYSPHEAALQQQQLQPVHPHDPYTDRTMHYSSDQHLPPAPSPQHRPPFQPHSTDLEQPLDLSLSRSPRPGSTGSMLDGLKRTRAEEPAGGGRSSHPGVCLMKGCGCQNGLPIHNPHHYGRLHRHSPYPQFSPSASSAGGHKSPAVGDMSSHPHSATPYSLPPQPSPFPAAPSLSSPSPAMLHEGNNSSSSSTSSSASYFSATPQGRRSPYSRPGLPASSSNSSLPPYGSDIMRQSPGSMLCPQQSSTSPLSISPRPTQDNSSPRPPNSQTLPQVRDASPNRPFYRPFEDTASGSVMEMGTSFSSSSLTINSNKMVAVERYRHTSEDDLTASSSLLLLSSTSSSSSSSVPASQQFSEHSWVDYRQEERERQQQQQQQSVKMDEDHRDAEPSQSDAGQTSNNASLSQLSPVPPHRTAHPSSYYYKAMSVVNDDRYMDMETSNLGQHNHQHSEDSGGHRVGSPAERSLAFSHHASHNDLTGTASSSSSSTTSCISSTSPSSSTPSTTTSSSYPSATAVPPKPTKKFVTVVGTSVLSSKARAEREKKQTKYSKDRMKELISSHHDQQQQPQPQQRQQHPSNVDGNDSEGGSDHSSGQASPRSSDGSEPDVGSRFTVPEGPSLKITPFDYMMMEYLVQTRDVPFKPCNREIRDIYTGVKKGPLTLVDLIELQVEASLMA